MKSIQKIKSNKPQNLIICNIMAIFLLLCVFCVGATYCWIEQQNKTFSTTATLGYVEGSLVLSGETIEDTITDGVSIVSSDFVNAGVDGAGISSLSSNVTNKGNISAILMCEYEFFDYTTGEYISIDITNFEISYSANWVQSEQTSNSSKISIYYNEVLNATSSTTIFESIANVSYQINDAENIYISITCKLVPYSGNSYQIGADQKQFEELSNEFLTQTWTAWAV